MDSLKVGDLVVSLYGHDQGKLFIVLEVKGSIAVICDGKARKADKPKNKNVKHLGLTGLSTDLINNVPQYAVDANIRREIKRLQKLI